jgi:hypothetical protein
VPAKRLTLLRDLVIDRRVLGEPARPQDRVVEIGGFDHCRRIPVKIENAAVSLSRHFAVDSHRADEDQALYSGLIHSGNDGSSLVRHVVREVGVDHVLAFHHGIERFAVGHITFSDRGARRLWVFEPFGISEKKREMDVRTIKKERCRMARKLPIGAKNEDSGRLRVLIGPLWR